MIRKLRIKFVLTSMLSLLAVLFFIICISTAISYSRLVTEADHILQTLEHNNGSFPKEVFAPSPELPFESRYFSVQLTDHGSLVAVDTEKIAAVDRDTAIGYAREILASGKHRGFIGNYRYAVQNTPGGTRILFLDCGRSLRNFQNFVATSIAVSCFGMTSVLILIIFFSKRVVFPVAESAEKQRRFITDAGHEIKTPLAIIQADVSVLELELGENEWLRDIQRQTERLTGLTNDLISLSRMEELEHPAEMTTFSLSELAEHAVSSFRSLAISQEKTFTTRIAPQLTIHGDETSLSRLLSILLDNALKYCPPHGTITFTLERQKKKLRLELTNTAEHIAPADLPHLFDRFYRTDQSRNSKTGGYGIGLSIANAIVTAHKGTISAATKDQRSLTITILLPSE